METPATTVDRQCGSAQQAVNFAAALVASGVHDVVIGAGVEHMGHVPMGIGLKWADEVGTPIRPSSWSASTSSPQGLSAELIADRWEIPRSELDELACGRSASRRGRPRRAASSARSSRSRSTATPT